MIVSLVTALALSGADYPHDAEQYSTWVQHACAIQQVGRNGGAPEDHTEFCTCLDDQVSQNASDSIYRIFALGSQGAIQDQSMLDDWEDARNTASAEAAALPAEEQAQIQPVLNNAVGMCFAMTAQ